MTNATADQSTAWPELHAPMTLIVDDPGWMYFASGTPDGYGRAHLRLFACAVPAGALPGPHLLPAPVAYIAVVTDLNDGLTVTNGCDRIWDTLQASHLMPLIQLEHYPHGRLSSSPDSLHFDQYNGDPDFTGPRWRPVSDISPEHPDHAAVAPWWAEHRDVLIGHTLPPGGSVRPVDRSDDSRQTATGIHVPSMAARPFADCDPHAVNAAAGDWLEIIATHLFSGEGDVRMLLSDEILSLVVAKHDLDPNAVLATFAQAWSLITTASMTAPSTARHLKMHELCDPENNEKTALVLVVAVMYARLLDPTQRYTYEEARDIIAADRYDCLAPELMTAMGFPGLQDDEDGAP